VPLEPEPAEPYEHEQAELREPDPAGERAGSLYYHLLVAALAAREEDHAQALASYSQAMHLSDDPRLAERAARLALQADEPALGQEAAQRWMALDAEATEPRQILALFELRLGERQAARDRLGALLREAGPGRDEVFAQVAAALSRERDRAAALNLLEQLVWEFPAEAHAHHALAQVASHFGQTERALAAVRRALLLEPNWHAPRLLMIRLHLQQGDGEQALAMVEKVLSERPDDYELRLYYARALLNDAQLEPALEQFELLLTEQPNDAQVLYGAALLAVELERLEEARAHLLQLVNLGQRLPDAYYYLGYIAELESDGKGALRWYNEVTGPRRYEAQLRMAVISAGKGSLDAARQRLARLREQHPEQAVRTRVVESELLSRAGKLDESLRVLDIALAEQPQAVELLYSRALLQVQLDNLKAAEADLRAILALRPHHADALNALGYTLVDRTDRLQEGFELIRRAYELKPDSAAIIDSMGWAYFRLGDPQTALRYLEEAYQLSDDPEIAAHLAEVLWTLGEREEAERILAEALEQYPDAPILKETRKRLR
jgi:Flp pilus assembly protein TadD